MTKNPSGVTDANGMTHPSEVIGKLLIIVKGNSNHRLKRMLQQWESERENTRNLKRFHPKRLNSGALIMDDAPFTRELCQWLKTMNFRGVVVMEYKPLWENMFD
jgi:hypothetical protein